MLGGFYVLHSTPLQKEDEYDGHRKKRYPVVFSGARHCHQSLAEPSR